SGRVWLGPDRRDLDGRQRGWRSGIAGHHAGGRNRDRAEPGRGRCQRDAAGRPRSLSGSEGNGIGADCDVFSGLGVAPMSGGAEPAPVYFLLVDEREENIVALEALLRSPGLVLLKARSGTEALELLLVHEVALALIDVRMPGMDGFELAELMRGTERTRRVPII